MHRADVIRLMDARDLRLVRRDAGAGPPVYQLLTGAQIHEERLRLRAREKARPRAGRWFAVRPRGPQDGPGPLPGDEGRAKNQSVQLRHCPPCPFSGPSLLCSSSVAGVRPPLPSPLAWSPSTQAAGPRVGRQARKSACPFPGRSVALL